MANTVISAFDMATAHFTYKGPANIEKPSFTTFTFLGSDDGDISNGGANTDTTPHTVTVHINPVNDAPAAKTTTVTTTLSDYTFKTTDFVATTAAQFDPNDFGANKGSPVHAAGTGDNFTGIFITTLPQSGVLNDKGVPVKAGDFIPAADISGNQLTFTPGADLANGPYTSFLFQAKDDGGTASGGADVSAQTTLSISGNVIHHAPDGTDVTLTANEDAALTLSVANFGFNDLQDIPADSPQGVFITSLPTAGTLRDNGQIVAPGQFIPVGDISLGLLKYTPPADVNGNNVASLTFQWKDSGGTANGGADTDPLANRMTFNVNAVNDAPAGVNASVNASASPFVFGAANFGLTDTHDSPANALAGIVITSLPNPANSLRFNNTAITAGQLPFSISLSQLNTGA